MGVVDETSSTYNTICDQVDHGYVCVCVCVCLCECVNVPLCVCVCVFLCECAPLCVYFIHVYNIALWGGLANYARSLLLRVDFKWYGCVVSCLSRAAPCRPWPW